MGNAVDDYKALTSLIEKLIRANSDPNAKEDLDKTFNIVHDIGDGLKILSNGQIKKK